MRKLGAVHNSLRLPPPHLFGHMSMTRPNPQCDWSTLVPSWPMLANDTIGDCTAAGALHMLQTWCANTGVKYTPTDAEAIALYSATSQYPAADTGASELVVLGYWANSGLNTPVGYSDIVYARVNPQDVDQLRLAIQYFGGVYLGLELPIGVQTATDWEVPSGGATGAGAVGSWGGHCVMSPKYDGQSFTVVSWGELIDATPAFLQTYCVEAYVLLSKYWLSVTGISPPGLNYDSLAAELATFH